MRNHRVITLSMLVFSGTLLYASIALGSTSETILPVNQDSIAGAPAPPTPLKENRIWDDPKGLGWETRFFDKPIAAFHVAKSAFHLPDGSGIPLKSPGKFPGIELGVEMNSFQALQSVVPPERLSKSLNSEQNQPVLLSPALVSSDYNGGFLRFTW